MGSAPSSVHARARLWSLASGHGYHVRVTRLTPQFRQPRWANTHASAQSLTPPGNSRPAQGPLYFAGHHGFPGTYQPQGVAARVVESVATSGHLSQAKASRGRNGHPSPGLCVERHIPSSCPRQTTPPVGTDCVAQRLARFCPSCAARVPMCPRLRVQPTSPTRTTPRAWWRSCQQPRPPPSPASAPARH